MPRRRLSFFRVVPLFLASPLLLFGQSQRLLINFDPATGIAQKTDAPAPHPLSFWTSQDKAIFATWNPIAPKTKPATTRQHVATLGTLAGYSIVQVTTTQYDPAFRPDGSGSQRKSLLARPPNGSNFQEIYRVDDASGGFVPFKTAAIYGTGPNAILGTYEQFGGNACAGDYWWFNASGPHPIDFSQLKGAVAKAIPSDATYDECGAIHPEDARLQAGVQKRNPECHACGGMGQVTATYRIDHGTAIPVSVKFDPDQTP